MMRKKRGTTLCKNILVPLCAELYFCQDLPQEEIAKRFNITKSYVSKILKEVKKSSIFDVRINFPPSEEQRGEIIRKYRLLNAVIVQVDSKTWEENETDLISPLKERLGQYAATYMESSEGPLASGIKVGVSCGATPLSAILPLNSRKYKRLKIVPLTVESIPELAYQSPSTLIGLLQAKYPEGTEVYAPQLISPALLSNRSGYQAIFNKIKNKIEEDVHNLDFALVGVSNVDIKDQTQSFIQILKQINIPLSILGKKSIIGEINNRPYDAQGNDLFEKFGDLGKHIIAISINQLKEFSKSKEKCVMAVAGGQKKVEAIRVALENKFINTLVTDSETAACLLKDDTKA